MIVLVKGVEVQCTFVGSYTGDGMVQGFLTFWEGGLRESNESSPLCSENTHYSRGFAFRLQFSERPELDSQLYHLNWMWDCGSFN